MPDSHTFRGFVPNLGFYLPLSALPGGSMGFSPLTLTLRWTLRLGESLKSGLHHRV